MTRTRNDLPFVCCQRAAATALTAAVMTLMSVAGFALTADHTHLVYQRDVLKAATDAATLATTRHLWTLDENLSTAAITAELMPIARRYILANIPESRRERATETLTITLTPDRSAGTVDIVAQADLGGIIFGSWMYGNMVPSTRVDSLSDLALADGTTDEQKALDPPVTEVVLAIDITSSMNYNLDESVWYGPMHHRRIGIVKRAAEALIDTIAADTSRTVAVGLVPWNYRVRFDARTRTRWEDHGWAQYPSRRYYPNPYPGSWRRTGTSRYPDPHRENPGGEWSDLPNRGSRRWNGCVDQRRMSGNNPPGILATLPTLEPFTMGFYTPRVSDLRFPVSFECHNPPYSSTRYQNRYRCYSDGSHSRHIAPQKECPNNTPPIMPLTTDVAAIKQRIRGLGASGAATYSTLGVAWGHRLLTPAWRNIWGDAVHPMDAAANVRKVLVLLTDGEDNHLGFSAEPAHRRQACTAAKNAGIEIITVFAGNPRRGTKTELLRCASPPSDGDDTNSFTGGTEEELEGVFETIGQRLRPLRRVR